MSDKVSQSTVDQDSASGADTAGAASAPVMQPQPEPDPAFISRADAELAQTESGWSEIEGVIAYDAEDGAQTAITQPANVQPRAPSSQPQPPVNNDSTPANSSISTSTDSSEIEAIIHPQPIAQQTVSGVTNRARAMSVVEVAIKAGATLAIIAAGWYAYRTYL